MLVHIGNHHINLDAIVHVEGEPKDIKDVVIHFVGGHVVRLYGEEKELFFHALGDRSIHA